MKQRGRPGWSADQVQFLRENAGSMTMKEIGFQIGRSRDAVNSKAYALGIGLSVKNAPKPHVWRHYIPAPHRKSPQVDRVAIMMELARKSA